jgi:hypothetical protein
MYIQMSENILANGSTVPAMPTGRQAAGTLDWNEVEWSDLEIS